jgi:predicted ATPase/DNA-binding XRE family transcriptional regulator
MFGALLRQVRVAHGLTQELLAERSGVSVRGISDLERGVRAVPQRATLRHLLAGLDLSAEEQALLLAAARRPPRPRLVSGDVRWPLALATREDAFIGRAAELTTVLRALHDPDHRLLTLTGPPGVGKTRLALETMRRLGALVPGEFVFVDLAPLATPQLVLPALAAAAGVREPGTGELLARLKTRLAAKPVVLVLDNFEHVLAAASVVGDLLQESSAVRFLVTSREPLRLSGEQVLAVPLLGMPPLTPEMGVRESVGHEAVELFVLRARESEPGFHLSEENARAIAELCVRLDGLPLAIELAAARVPQLTPAAIVERLAERRPVLTAGRRELPTRQRTLADAIDWSYELLGEDEQRLLRRLSVFRGGFTLPAAEAVANAANELDVVRGIAALTDKCLLVRQTDATRGVRYGMLETIRDYALERLAASGEEAAARLAYASYFLALAEQAAPDMRTGDGQRASIGRLEAEHDNLRQALDWALERTDASVALRLTEALWGFWWGQGHLSEGQRWLARALERSREAPPAARAKTLVASGRLAWLRGELDTARLYLEEALTLGPRPFDRCEALNALGDVARYQGDYGRAEAVLAEALAVGRAHDDGFHIAASLHNLGTVALDRGDYDRAREALEAGLDRARQDGHRYLAISDLHYLSRLAFEQGDYARSAALRREDLAAQRELAPDVAHGTARFLEGVALLAVVQDQLVAAARLFGAAAALHEDVEDVERVELTPLASWIATARERLGTEAFTREWAAGRTLPLDTALDEAAAVLEESRSREVEEKAARRPEELIADS